MFACICHAVSESEVRGLVADGVDDVDLLGEITGAGTGCGSCLVRLDALVAAGCRPHAASVDASAADDPAASRDSWRRHEVAGCPRLELAAHHVRS